MKIYLSVFVGVFVSAQLFAGDLSVYRGFRLGDSLSRVAKIAELEPSDATLVQSRPAKIQELDWHPYFAYNSSNSVDPVSEAVFSFYNDQLYRTVVSYDRHRVEGMTGEDIIQSISALYGVPTRPQVAIPFYSPYSESAPVLARWENEEYSYSLIRTGDNSSFVLIVLAKRLDTLAQASKAEAVRLDAQEAPQRAIDEQKQQEATDLLAAKQMRSVNKPNFRP